MAYYTRIAAALNSGRSAHAGRQTTRQMSSTGERDDRSPREPRGRPPLLIAAGFIGAFAASIATIIYTGLLVDGPRRESAADGDTLEAGIAAPQDAGANARPERTDGVGAVADGRPADDAASQDPESTRGELGNEAEIGATRDESTR